MPRDCNTTGLTTAAATGLPTATNNNTWCKSRQDAHQLHSFLNETSIMYGGQLAEDGCSFENVADVFFFPILLFIDTFASCWSFDSCNGIHEPKGEWPERGHHSQALPLPVGQTWGEWEFVGMHGWTRYAFRTIRHHYFNQLFKISTKYCPPDGFIH